MSSRPALRPIDPAWPEARKLAMIEIALRNGLPWQAVAAQAGVSSRVGLKRLRRELGRQVRARQQAR